MKPGNLIKLNSEEGLFVFIGRTRGRDGIPLIVLEDIQRTTVRLVNKDQILGHVVSFEPKISQPQIISTNLSGDHISRN